MKVYFLSAQPCALTLNGAFFGVCDNFERFAEISLTDKVFAQFSPANATPIGCFLTPDLRFNPPNGFEVYLLPDGLALYARDFPPRDFTLTVRAQERNGNNLATLYQQGNLYLSIQTNETLVSIPLPNELLDGKIFFTSELVGIETSNRLALFTLDGNAVFNEEITEYSIENSTLNASLPLSNALGRYAKCRYELSKSGCVRTDVSLMQSVDMQGNRDKESVEKSLLPFAFFESVLLGVDYKRFLCEELLEKAESLRAFLGEFVAVSPTRKADTGALVKRKGERLYEVVHYTVEITDGKITDVRC